ncbi:hypothetical protein HHI36_008627 [Cryptolaemus montrouzieri]|uniref:Uncharacterized protein n=1 Tax=Cryptolaemus montrouzieri TaxID=559131 RepID=A0ABD2MTJ9_9CUCU
MSAIKSTGNQNNRPKPTDVDNDWTDNVGQDSVNVNILSGESSGKLNNNSDGFKLVLHRKPKRFNNARLNDTKETIRDTNTDNTMKIQEFSSVYFGRVLGDVSEETFKEFSNDSWPEQQFRCYKPKTKGNNSSYKNIDRLEQAKEHETLINLLNEYNIKPHIREPMSFDRGGAATCIDNILLNMEVLSACVGDTYLSDHTFKEYNAQNVGRNNVNTYPSIDESIFLAPVTAAEVIGIVRKTTRISALGIDGVDGRTLNPVSGCLSEILAYSINESLCQANSQNAGKNIVNSYPSIDKSVFLAPVTAAEVIGIIRKTTRKPAPGIVGVNGIILNPVSGYLSEILAYLINESFCQANSQNAGKNIVNSYPSIDKSVFLAPVTAAEVIGIIRKTTRKPAPGIVGVDGRTLNPVSGCLSEILAYSINESLCQANSQNAGKNIVNSYPSIDKSVFLAPVTAAEVIGIIRKTTRKPAPGIVGVDGIILNPVSGYLSEILAYLINESFCQANSQNAGKNIVNSYPSIDKSVFLAPATAAEVIGIIRKTTRKSAPGIVGVDGIFLNPVSGYLSEILAYLINESFCQG